MAVFYTIEGVESVYNEGLAALNLMSGVEHFEPEVMIDNILQKLTEKIEQLQAQEGDFLAQFNCSSIEQFKSRLQAFYRISQLNMFTNANLRSIISEYRKVLEQRNDIMREKIERVFENLIHLEIDDKFKNALYEVFNSPTVSEAVANDAISILMSTLSGYGAGGQLKSMNFITKKEVSKGQYALEICADLTTKAFNEHFKDLQAQARKRKLDGLTEAEQKKIKDAQILLKKHEKTQVNQNSLSQTFGVEYGILTRSNEKNPKFTDEELKQINPEITELIVSKLTTKYGNAIRDFARNRLNSLANSNPNIYLTHGSWTQLEGILGEISAYTALYYLMGNQTNSSIEWTAQQLKDGKQLSIDLVLKTLGRSFGIQVKNTMVNINNDTNHAIAFANSSLEHLLGKLNINNIDNNKDFSSIKDVYISDIFNVPYQLNGDIYKEVSKDYKTDDSQFYEYIRIDDLIDDLVSQINLFLTMFASDFLYMGAEDEFKSSLATLNDSLDSLGGNFVYIVGDRATFASEILATLKTELRLLKHLKEQIRQSSFQIEAYFDKVKGDAKELPYNIVTVMNGKAVGTHLHTLKTKTSWNKW